MLVIGALSNTVALLPVGIALLILPWTICLLADSVAKHESEGVLPSPQKYNYFAAVIVAGLAISGSAYVGKDYFADALTAIYVVLGLVSTLVSFVIVLVVAERASKPKTVKKTA